VRRLGAFPQGIHEGNQIDVRDATPAPMREGFQTPGGDFLIDRIATNPEHGRRLLYGIDQWRRSGFNML
jgi:hypothetical protein